MVKDGEQFDNFRERPVVEEGNTSAYEEPVNYVNEGNKPAGVDSQDENWEQKVEPEARTASAEEAQNDDEE